MFENAAEVCRCLSSLCGNLPENEIVVFEEFVAIMYDRSTSTNKVSEAHLNLFARKQRPYNGIPPSKPLLLSISSTTYMVGNRYASR